MKAAPEVREIDGLEFEVSQLGVKDARAAFVKLANVVGPGLSEFSNAQDATAAIGKLMATVSPEDLEFLCAQFSKGSRVKIGELMVSMTGAGEAVFQGRIMTMFKWLWFCAEVNFSDFLGGLKDIGGLPFLKGKVSPSKSPTE